MLEASDEPGITAVQIHADGSYADKLTVNAHLKNGVISGDPYTRMDGAVVYRFAVEKMTNTAAAVANGEQVDWLVAHQANKRIIDAVRRRLNISEEKTVLTVGEQGNTSAASIPLALASRAADFRRGDKIMLTAVGGGFTWGALLLTW